MRVGTFEPDPSFGGGSERVVFDVSRYLAGRGHELFLIHDENGTMLPTYGEFIAARHRMPLQAFGWRTLAESIGRARRIAKQWSEWHVDVVFGSDLHYLRLLAISGWFAGIPVVLHLGLPNPLPYWSQTQALRFFAAGVAPSAHTSDAWLRAGWPASRISVVPNGVDTDRFRPAVNREAVRCRLGLPRDRFIVAYVGRLVPQKGLVTLLDAAVSLRARGRSVLWVIVGTDMKGTVEPWLSAASRRKLSSDDVMFVGRRSNPEDYLAAADLAVVPSECEETFGLAAIEAMACATPAVVSDLGVLPDLVGASNRELVFPVGRADVLADRILWLMDNPSRLLALGRDAATTAAAYSITERVGPAYESILMTAIRQS